MASNTGIVELMTTFEPPNATNVVYKDLIVVNKVKTRNAFQDIGTGFKSLVGGEVKNLTKLTSEIRRELMQEARQQAEHIGANAIVGVRFETNSVWEGTLDIVMYGTAIHYDRAA